MPHFTVMDTQIILMPMVSRRQFLIASSMIVPLVAHPQFAQAASALSAFKPSGSAGFDHSALDALLDGAVQTDAEGYNRVDYRTLKAKAAALKAYLEIMQSAVPSSFSKSEAKAFWINLYNAKTLDIVIARYPIASIKKINLGGGGLFGSGPWSAKVLTVEGQELSLDDIEHAILRPLFNDPMVHYALNCASYSCPNLSTSAFTAKNTTALMQASASAYVNHPRGVNVVGSAITASKIYSWYGADFGGKSKLKPHWLKFATPEKAEAISAAQKVSFDYDWRLNDV
jgi:Protein of unknown function, DUF547